MRLFALSLLLCPFLMQCQPVALIAEKPVMRQLAPLPAPLVYIDEVLPEIRVELMYAGADNFVGRPLAGYTGKRAVIRRDVVPALARALATLKKQGYGLILKDAYRPLRAMNDFYAWSLTPDESMRAKYYPRISKKEIYEHKYIRRFSEHCWAIAVDVTLYDLATGQELDMGGPVDFLDESSATSYVGSRISAAARKHRGILRSAMYNAGMSNYRKEWWHYWLRGAKVPGIRHYDFPLNDARPSFK